MLGASYGANYEQQNTEDKAALPASGFDFGSRSVIIGQLTYKATKSLRTVLEYDYFQSNFQDASSVPGASNKADDTNQFAIGMMLFF